MLNSRMSRRSFLGVSAAGLAATVLDWNRINAFAEKMGARQDYPTVVIGAERGVNRGRGKCQTATACSADQFSGRVIR